MQVVSASLMVAAHIASASQIAAAQMALASLMVVLVLDASLLCLESMEGLVVSHHPMATFISPCSQSTYSDRVPRSALRWVSDHGVEAMLAAVRLFNTGGRDGEWLIGTEMWMSAGVAACCGTCKELAIGSGMAESAPSDPSGSSTLVWGGAPKATDGGFLLGVLCWETGIEVAGEVCCSCSKAPLIWKLRVLVIVGWGYMAEMVNGAGVVLIASGVVLHKFTPIMTGSQTASSVVAAFQSGSSSKSNTKALIPAFSPPGQITHSPHCSYLHACNWWRKP